MSIAACGEERGGRIDPDIGDPLEVEVEPLVADPVAFAASFPDMSVLAAGGTVLHLGTATGGNADYGPAAGEVASAAFVEPDTVVVSGSEGLFAVQGRMLVPSALGDVVPTETPPRLLAAPGDDGDDLWIATPDGLSVWRAGTLYGVSAGDLSTQGALLAWGAPLREDGAPALWVSSGGDLFAVRDDDAYPSGHDVTPDSIAVDGRGLLWVASGGELHRRSDDGVWEWLALPDAARAIHANHRRRDLWVETDGGLWHGDGSRFEPVANAPEGALFGVDPAGRALVAGESGLYRIAAGRLLLLSGLEDGSSLVGFATVTIAPTSIDGLEAVEATLDDEPAELLESPWRVLLDPSALGDGAHHVDVAATYDDADEPVRASLYFTVGEFEPATWSRDVEPLFVDSCKKCHGPDGGAHLLNTRERWQNEVEKVLEMVSARRMPLPPNEPLSEEEIQLIQSWRAGGFPE